MQMPSKFLRFMKCRMGGSELSQKLANRGISFKKLIQRLTSYFPFLCGQRRVLSVSYPIKPSIDLSAKVVKPPVLLKISMHGVN